MSTPTSPADVKLPQRSNTVSSSFTRRTSLSDDEAIPDGDSNEVCIQGVLEEKKYIGLTMYLFPDY